MDIASLAQMGQSILGANSAAPNNDAAAEVISSMIPKEFYDKLPPAIRPFITQQVIEAAAKQAPEILEMLKKGGNLTGTDAEKLKSIISTVAAAAGK